MNKLLKLLSLALILIGTIYFSACEGDEEEEVNPLVGTWDISSLSQSSVYLAAVDIAALGFAEGDTVASGSMSWAEFSALGVNAEVIIEDNGTFSLEGDLPQANDTLGVAPDVVHLIDTGTWTHDETAGTFLLDGGLYDLGGLLTLDDPDNPTTITLAYADVDTSVAKVLPVAGVGYFDVLLDEHSSTVLVLTKQ